MLLEQAAQYALGLSSDLRCQCRKLDCGVNTLWKRNFGVLVGLLIYMPRQLRHVRAAPALQSFLREIGEFIHSTINDNLFDF